MRKTYDILCAGELFVEFATAEFAQTPEEALLFRRIPGGNPANLSMNMSRLGNSAMLVSCVGNDAMGEMLINHVARLGVDVSYLTKVEDPTTLLLTTRSGNGSTFQWYRGAESQLSIRQFPYGRFEQTAIFHTTCFALSRNPAQSVILEAAEKARRAGCRLSIDANYNEKIWPDQKDARRAVAEFCRLGAVVKISDEDFQRLYGDQPTPEAVLEHFFKMGASEICFTLGDKGLWVADDHEQHFLPSRPVEVKDPVAGGAGDAFWAGYLTAWIDEKPLLERAMAGRMLAELKLSILGPLPDKVERERIYEGVE